MTKELKNRMGETFFFTLLLLAPILSSCRSDPKFEEFKHVNLQDVQIHYNIAGKESLLSSFMAAWPI